MSDSDAHLDSHLRIGGTRAMIGGARSALLEQIAATGSISAAAKAAGLSYKAAWDAVAAMNNLADTALVERVTGGVGGGGSRLTERGARLVRTYRAAEAEQARFMARLNRRVRHLTDDMDLMGRLAMTTSARNQLFGHVEQITHGRVNTEVEVGLRGGDRLAAIVTRTSADNLGLEIGVPITALVKASWVIVAAGDLSSTRLSARNRLAGTVASVTTDDVSGEIVIRLPGGMTLAATVTRDSSDTLDLEAGDTATALFKASSVILAQGD